MPFISDTELRELKLRGEKLIDTYTDRHGLVWERPTAWAWFAANRAIAHRQEALREAAACIETFIEFGRRVEKVPDCMVLTAGSTMAARQLTAGDLKCLVKLLQDLTGPIDTTLDREHDAKIYGNNKDVGDPI